MNSAVVLEDWTPPSPRPVTPSTILAKELGELYRRLAATDPDGEVLTLLRRACDLADGLDPYLGRCTTAESSALAALARRTHETNWDADPTSALEQEMLSGHVEGQLLKFLVHMTGARRVLEIGMFTGYSALAMAEALPDDGRVLACELDADVARLARECFDDSPDGEKISIAVGPAVETLGQLAADERSRTTPFDLVFIDADKASYVDYVELLLGSELLSPRAVIAVDNTLMQGQPYLAEADRTANGAAIATFNAAVAADPRIEQVLIPLRDGVTLIRRTPQGPPR